MHVCVEFAKALDKCVLAMPAVRKYRRDTSEVSCCLKYVIFGFNVMFWVSLLHLHTVFCFLFFFFFYFITSRVANKNF